MTGNKNYISSVNSEVGTEVRKIMKPLFYKAGMENIVIYRYSCRQNTTKYLVGIWGPSETLNLFSDIKQEPFENRCLYLIDFDNLSCCCKKRNCAKQRSDTFEWTKYATFMARIFGFPLTGKITWRAETFIGVVCPVDWGAKCCVRSQFWCGRFEIDSFHYALSVDMWLVAGCWILLAKKEVILEVLLA